MLLLLILWYERRLPLTFEVHDALLCQLSFLLLLCVVCSPGEADGHLSRNRVMLVEPMTVVVLGCSLWCLIVHHNLATDLWLCWVSI